MIPLVREKGSDRENTRDFKYFDVILFLLNSMDIITYYFVHTFICSNFSQ